MSKNSLHLPIGKNKKRIFVSTAHLRQNRKMETPSLPPIICTTESGRHENAFEIIARDSAGKEVFRVVYRPLDPVTTHTEVWIETTVDLELKKSYLYDH